MTMQNYDKTYWKESCPEIKSCEKKKCPCGLQRVTLPAAMGDDSQGSPIAPTNGAYCNTLVVYEANGHKYIYSKEGVPTLITSGGGGDYDEIIKEIQDDLSETERNLSQETINRVASDNSMQLEINAKQNTLVSGTNIKTINNQSILGSGNITVEGGTATDVQINGSSITVSGTANIVTEGVYNASTNKIATMSDIPDTSNFITKSVDDLTNYTKTSDLGSLATKNTVNYETEVTNKPTIPSQVTEETVSGWGFTKNTGTYSKPSGGIPKSDLSSAVQTSLGKADTSIQPNDLINYQLKPTTQNIAETSATITPIDNTIYQCGELTSLTITNPPADGMYIIIFTSGATPTTTTIPTTIHGFDDFAAEANMRYEINVMNNYALIAGWEVTV